MRKFLVYIIISGLFFCILTEKVFSAPQKAAVFKQQKYSLETELYEKAKIELTPSFYEVYRVAERLARANKLDDCSWRIVIPTGEKGLEVNASASDENMITLYPGLLDSFSGDISALAFTIGHEMAHNKMMHVVQGLRMQINLIKASKDLDDLYKNKIESTMQEGTALGCIMGYSAYSYSRLKYQEDMEELERKKHELEIDFYAGERRKEYEADKLGLIYMTRAGFAPESAIKVLQSFKKDDPGIPTDTSTHPPPDNRIWQIENQIKSLDIDSLRKEGRINMVNSLPLTFGKSENKQSIRIDSRCKPVENINKLFKGM